MRAHAGPLELDGEATIFVAFADVTQQHLAEDALRTSEARFRSLFEASVDGIALLDGPTLTLQEINPAFVRLTGVSPEDLVGSRIRALFPHDHRWAVSATLRQALHQGRGGPLAVSLLRPNDEQRRVELSASAVRVGGALFAMVSVRDVHEQWLSVQRRRVMERQLWQTQKAELLGDLAGGIAHEFNNTLAAIHGLATALRAGLPDDDTTSEQRKDLDAILEASTRGKHLALDLLGFAGRGAAESRVYDLRAVLDRVRSLASGFRPRLAVQLVEHERRIPVSGDPVQLEHALLALVRSAAPGQASPGGRSEARVEVRVADATRPLERTGPMQSGVELTLVAPGESDWSRRLTDSALAFASPGGENFGEGIQYGMIFKTMEDHGGDIEVLDSAEGSGDIRIWLPLADEPVEEGVEGPAQPRIGVTVHRVLVIDDQPMVLRATTRMLECDGYRVQTAGGGVEGLQTFAAGSFDAVLVDLTMPDMDGEEVLTRLADSGTDAVLIGMTGHVERALPEALTRRVAAVLRKPFSAEDLRRALAVLDL